MQAERDLRKSAKAVRHCNTVGDSSTGVFLATPRCDHRVLLIRGTFGILRSKVDKDEVGAKSSTSYNSTAMAFMLAFAGMGDF